MFSLKSLTYGFIIILLIVLIIEYEKYKENEAELENLKQKNASLLKEVEYNMQNTISELLKENEQLKNQLKKQE